MSLTIKSDPPVGNVAHPLDILRSSQLVLRDEEGSVVSLDEFRGDLERSERIVDNAAINIENSSDVIIGPVTQFNGPVTIYQNVNNGIERTQGIENESFENKGVGDRTGFKDAKLVKSESASSDVSYPGETSSKPFPLNSKYVKYVGIAVLALIVVAITVTITTQLLSGAPEDSQSTNETESSDPQTSEPDNSLGSHLFIYRQTWGGRPSLNFTRPLRHPIPLVILSHTAGNLCYTIPDCSLGVRVAQALHVNNLKSPDVGYNFLVGGDGNVYVGRGWNIRNFHQDNSLGICFIGNFVFDELTPTMVEATRKLLEFGVETGKLTKDYKLICHNQTLATLSPGVNVYKVVKDWPHFDPSTVY